MNPFALLFRSSIGRKFIMAVTGLILVGFVTGHLVGNLQIFGHPDKINGYAHFLQSLGPVLWAVRLGLLVCAGLHVWAAVTLTLENWTARGPESYGIGKWLNAALASRYMKHSGVVVLAFIVYHLAHFTVGATQSGSFKSNLPDYSMAGDFHLLGFPIVAKGQVVHDVYSMVFLGFTNPFVSLFYIIAVGLLSLHLMHGVDSMFQTLGWRNQRWSGWLRKLVLIFSLAYFLGNVAIPGAILGGIVPPAAGTTAAVKAAVAVRSTSIPQR